MTAEANEQKITDVVLGEIDGKPGLQQVKELLSGEREKVKRQAQLNLKTTKERTKSVITCVFFSGRHRKLINCK